MDMEEEVVITSSAPNQWPLTLYDPGSFRLPNRKIERVYVGCTGWDSIAFVGPALAYELNHWHEAEGWRGIKWHFIIDKAGNIVTGRPLDEVPPISDTPLIGGALAIVVHGVWHFTALELISLRVLCRVIDGAYKLEGEVVQFLPMSELGSELANPPFDVVAATMSDDSLQDIAESATCMRLVGVP